MIFTKVYVVSYFAEKFSQSTFAPCQRLLSIGEYFGSGELFCSDSLNYVRTVTGKIIYNEEEIFI
jgi:hypothetical protein